MSEKDNFSGGFLLGTLVGGIVGGVIGTLLANQNKNISQENESDSSVNNFEKNEDSRLKLEDKINQLNHAIDDVRVTLLKNVGNHEKEIINE